jgi:threonine synthase
MNYVTKLRCVICQESYAPGEVRYVCPRHGPDGILDVEYDYEAARAGLVESSRQAAPGTRHTQGTLHTQGMFAYWPLLPLPPGVAVPPLPVGGTPLLSAPRLAAPLGLTELWVKDDSRNPTASLKDRASAVAVMKAQELGAEIVTTASTGNAAAALAGLAASVGQKAVIFVPATAPPAKIAQLLVYGATVLLVEGSYDDAFELCLEASDTFGWYCRNTAYNPYMAEGKKTVILEMYDQLLGTHFWGLGGDLSRRQPPVPLPDYLFVSVGDGCIISGVHKGLRDLVALGVLSQVPRLMGVQAAGSSYLYDAWRNDEDVLTKPPVAVDTLADSIGAGLPRDRIKAMTAVRQTGGAFIQVSDEEILAAIPALARGCAVFAEPAAAAAYAGLVKAVATGQVEAGRRVAVLVTGSGLKDVGATMKATGQARTIRPNLNAIRRALA